MGAYTSLTMPLDRTENRPRPSVASGGPLALPASAPLLLPHFLRAAAARHRATSIVALDAAGHAVSVSYGALQRRAARVAAGLGAAGIGSGEPVVVQIEPAIDFLTAFWGCQLAGAVAAPMPALGSAPPSAAQRNRFAHLQALLGRPPVLTCRATADAQSGIGSTSSTARAWFIEDLLQCDGPAPDHQPRPDDLALLLCTSGSSGLPRLVEQTHARLSAFAGAAVRELQLTPADVSLQWLPLDHVGGLVMCHLRDVLAGCRQVHAAAAYVLADPLRWIDLLHHERATVSWAPHFAFALVAAEPGPDRGWDLRRVRVLVNGGEPIVARSARRFLSRFAPYGLARTAMVPAWGMSETCSAVVLSRAFCVEQTRDENREVDVGTPLPGTQIRIVDECGTVVPEGVTGGLEVRGPTVTTGYWGDAAATRAAFAPGGWLRTGDLGFVRDGRLTVTGRAKDILIVRGANFASHELEAVVETVPGIASGAVAVCAVRRAAGGSDEIAVFFATRQPEPAGAIAIVAQIQAVLASQLGLHADHCIPLAADAFPRTGIGKLQRAELRRRFESGALRSLAPAAPIVGLHAVQWRRAALPRTAAVPAGPWLLCGPPGALREALVRRFATAGAPCVCVDSAAALHAAAAGALHQVAVLVPGAGAAVPRGAPGDRVLASLLQMAGIARLLRAGAGTTPRQLWLVTAGAVAIRDRESPDCGTAPVRALARTLPREIECLRAATVDLDPRETAFEQAAALWRSFTEADPLVESAWRGRERWQPRLVPVLPTAPEHVPWRHAGCYVLAGGAGGVGLHVAAHLTRTYGARVMLLGRTPIAVVTPRLRALHDHGAGVEYVAADVGDAAAVHHALQAAETGWGRALDAVVHLAGVATECELAFETATSLQAGLRAKVEGAWVLHQEIDRRPNATFISFGSCLSALGAARMGTYAAANEFLAAMAQFHRARGRRSVHIAWAPWEGIGMSRTELAGALRGRGVPPMRPSAALAALDEAVRGANPCVFAGLDASQPEIAARLADPQDAPRPAARIADTASTPCEAAIARLWEEVLGVPVVRRHDNFFALGGDSLAAVRVMCGIESALGSALPSSTLLHAPTVAELAAQVGLAPRIAPAAATHSMCEVVALRNGGSWAPLFCLPGAGDPPEAFAGLTAALDARLPVYAVRAPILDIRPAAGPVPSVEDLATAFLRAIRQVQPRGPYRLAGHCLGGMLAYELAGQLVRAGETVSLLALLDSLAGGRPPGRIVAPAVDRIRMHWHAVAGKSWQERFRYLGTRAIRSRAERTERREFLDSRIAVEAIHEHYIIPLYPGTVTLFLASESYLGRAPHKDPRRRWAAHAARVEVIAVGGDHQSLLQPPHAAGLAAHVQARLGLHPVESAHDNVPVLDR